MLVTSWALIGGYTFNSLPFLGVRVTVSFAVAALIAGFLVTLRPSRGSRAWALGICAICAVASVLAILLVWWDIPRTTVDVFGDGRARVDLVSFLVGGVIALIYLVAAIIATVRFGVQVLASEGKANEPKPSRIGRPTTLMRAGSPPSLFSAVWRVSDAPITSMVMASRYSRQWTGSQRDPSRP